MQGGSECGCSGGKTFFGGSKHRRHNKTMKAIEKFAATHTPKMKWIPLFISSSYMKKTRKHPISISIFNSKLINFSKTRRHKRKQRGGSNISMGSQLAGAYAIPNLEGANNVAGFQPALTH